MIYLPFNHPAHPANKTFSWGRTGHRRSLILKVSFTFTKTNNVREKPLLEDGANVSVILISGNIKIRSSGKLLEDGYKGRSVRVLLSTGKKMEGRLQDENTVIINLK